MDEETLLEVLKWLEIASQRTSAVRVLSQALKSRGLSVCPSWGLSFESVLEDGIITCTYLLRSNCFLGLIGHEGGFSDQKEWLKAINLDPDICVSLVDHPTHGECFQVERRAYVPLDRRSDVSKMLHFRMGPTEADTGISAIGSVLAVLREVGDRI